MANTRLLTNQVEDYIRTELARQFGQPFQKQFLPISQRLDGSQAMHEFDAVSADGTIVAGIKSASGKTGGGRRPAGKIASAYQELYFLSLVRAERRILVLTAPDFYEILRKDCDGKLAAGLELMLIELPPLLKAQVQVVQTIAREEMATGKKVLS